MEGDGGKKETKSGRSKEYEDWKKRRRWGERVKMKIGRRQKIKSGGRRRKTFRLE